jgi:hypothetical protein
MATAGHHLKEVAVLKTWKTGLLVVAALILGAVALQSTVAQTAAARANEDAKTGGPHYTVIETQGFNLLVTDNAANKLYYYASDKDAAVGAPLKLRASVDLSQVGTPEITLKPHNLENIRSKTSK